MKFFIVFALFALAAAKPSLRLSQAEIDEIVAAINSPSTHPATAAALQHMLVALGLAEPEPIHVGPEIVDVDNYEPIHVGPEIVDVDNYEPIHVGPEIVDHDNYEPIHVGPEIVDFPIPESVVNPTPVSSPLVQIIVNVKKPEDFVTSPVVVEGLDKPEPAPSPVNVIEEAFVPSPVQVADSLPLPPKPVQVVDEAHAPVEPVLVAPGIVSPVVVGPEILN